MSGAGGKVVLVERKASGEVVFTEGETYSPRPSRPGEPSLLQRALRDGLVGGGKPWIEIVRSEASTDG